MAMKAVDVMAQPVVVVKKTDSLEAAARLMVDHVIGGLPVVDEEGRMVGMITESDFQAHHGFAPFSLFEMPRLFGRMIDVEGMERIYADSRTTPVSRLMRPRPRGLEPEANIEDAARIMIEHGLHHVPIVQDGKPVGMVARRDLLKILLKP
jgi:CBS domain-containing protein